MPRSGWSSGLKIMKSRGERAGEENHTLVATEIPQHTHSLTASSSDSDFPVPTGGALAAVVGANIYTDVATPTVALSPASIQSTGGSQAHLNEQPSLALNFCIALQGNFPSQN